MNFGNGALLGGLALVGPEKWAIREIATQN
jgi:hypothetical protein